MSSDLVIVGAGNGGVTLATNLVKAGFEGSISLLSAESVIPYERPPLSKGYLTGEESFEQIVFRTAEYWAASPVDLVLGVRVVRVDPDSHTVVLEDGRDIGYGKLVWAAGGTPRVMDVPGASLEGIHAIRDLLGIERLRSELPAASNAVIVGGGYVGLETAAAFRKLGMDVTVVEVADRLLARVTSTEVSRYYHELHTSRGVDIRLGTSAIAFQGDRWVESVTLDTLETIPADVVVVGIGLVPNVGPLADAGARCGNGVEVDEFCRTSLPDVYAIGDCAAHVNSYAAGRRVRLESVQNAADQAATVAHHLQGTEAPYRAVPWFWSNQYDIRLKTAGIVSGFDDVVVRGDPATDRFAVVYLRDGRICAVDCVNSPGDFMVAKQLIGRGTHVERDDLADGSVPLKVLLNEPTLTARRSA
jgi:3-phenylpropionate/trans-cinnamate dioxygenase ferredoxin reductase subunit